MEKKMKIVKLQSSDGVIFDTDMYIAECSGTIKSLLDNVDVDFKRVIPLGNINSKTLKHIVKWVNHKKDEENSKVTENTENTENLENKEVTEGAKHVMVGNTTKPAEEVLSPAERWYKQFIDIPEDEVLELVMAANFLDIQELFDATCRTVASWISGTTNKSSPTEETKYKTERVPANEVFPSYDEAARNALMEALQNDLAN